MTASAPLAQPAPSPKLSDLMAQWPGAIRVDSSCTLAEAVARLDSAPDAPGLMVESEGSPPIPISRATVSSRLTQCINTHDVLRGALARTVARWRTPMLEVPASTPLSDAVKAALARPPATRFEPLVIVEPSGPVLMVDLRVLLLAQCSALELAVSEVSAAKAAAEEAAAARTRFLVSLGHEIRTPMTAIVGFAEVLAGDLLPASERSEHGAAIRRNADHLLAIVNDLLDASKIESGKMTVERIPCNPLQCVDDAMAILRPAAAARGLTFSRAVTGDIPEAITSDPLRIRQILLNLLSNAIKFTQHGSVLVNVMRDRRAGSQALCITVTDTGPGMTVEQCRDVFGGFSQADHTISRRFGGTGLGLSISREFAQLMGGTLACSSTPGRGSTFTLTIADVALAHSANSRQLVPSTRAEPMLQSRLLEGLRILVAEDGPDNRRLLQTHLTRAGAEVILVSDGLAAVQVAMAPAYGVPPIDVVLMDLEMPIMDGLQATRLLRSRNHRGIIIALTAHSSREHRELSLDAGCNDHLVKPIDRAVLIQTVANWAKNARRASHTRADAA